MKTFFLRAALVLSLALNFILIARNDGVNPAEASATENIREEATADADWDVFITALAWVESRWDDEAVSPKQAVGYLQVTPILVEDANRIAGEGSFSLEGRTDRDESIRLFNVIMDNYNPQHDLQFALKIWNPYSKVSYHRAVMRKYDELKQKSI